MSVIILNEWLSYVLTAINWPTIDNTFEEESIRLLIAADPQILSTQSEPNFPFNLITTWDADRFVSRGFHLALWRSKPEIVIFLGDVLDDGSTSNDLDFAAQAHHFMSLMRLPSYVKHAIYVPGDNDIGGEGLDLVTHHKVERFFQIFNQSTSLSYKFADFIQVRIMDESDNTSLAVVDEKRIRIILSHIPLLPITRPSIKKILTEHRPSFIFSGHEHQSLHFVGHKDRVMAEEFWPLKNSGHVWAFETLSERLHEVTVPTCSYRMGKKTYGYGVAVVGKSGLIQYSVLWLPSRFTQLWLYLFSLIIVLLVILPPLMCWTVYSLESLCRSCVVSVVNNGLKYHRI